MGCTNAAMLRPTMGVVLAALFVLACSSTEDIGQSRAQVDTICNEAPTATLDGIPAYAFCGNFNVWSNNGIDTQSTSGGAGWIRTETNAGYQCAEYALRYSRFRFGVTTVWSGISYAYEMCATHPAAMSTTNTPVHGDLIVFAPSSCGADATAGHVAVVDKVNASTIDVVQENPAAKTTYNTACASCFLHAANNLGANDPCETATANGSYCGQTPKFFAGTTGDLYDCEGGVTMTTTVCASGCVPGNPDACASSPSDAGADASGDAAPPLESGAPPSDAGAASDSGGVTTSNNSGGCAMTTTHGNASESGALALVVLAIVLRRKK